jgi:hypothetical protein
MRCGLDRGGMEASRGASFFPRLLEVLYECVTGGWALTMTPAAASGAGRYYG